jgi:hypothetical protein
VLYCCVLNYKKYHLLTYFDIFSYIWLIYFFFIYFYRLFYFYQSQLINMERYNILVFLVLMAVSVQAQFINNGATVTIQTGATLRVETNIENNGTGTFTNNGTIEVSGNFTNASTATLTGGAGLVKFIGSANTTLNTGGDALFNVQMDKIGNKTVTLSAPATVAGNLSFTGENSTIKLSGNDLALASTTTVSANANHSTNGYVVTNGAGKLVRTNLGGTPFTFTVGYDTTSYNPITIAENGTIDNIGVRVLEKAYENGVSGTAITSEVVDASWIISEASGGNSNLTITPQWLTADEMPSFTRNDCGVAKYVGPTYDLLLAGMGASTGSGTAADLYKRQRTAVTPGTFVVGDDKVMDYVAVSPKVFLHGAYGFSTNSTGLMTDNLRLFLPTTEPYTGYTNFTYAGRGSGETVNPSVFVVTGNDAIVDWIFLQVRNTVSPYSVVATKSALLQRDGDIVDIDGGPVKLRGIASGTYKVAVRHRNHLGILTNNNQSLSSTTTALDFTNSTTPEPVLGGLTLMNYVALGTNPAYVMIPGDGNVSGSVTASDNIAIWRPSNSQFVSSSNYLTNVGKADFNLSGSVTASDNIQMWRPSNSKLQSFSNN